jgi:ribosomal protein S18 acetylase RimI-like enzyme
MSDSLQAFSIRSYQSSDRAGLEALWHRVFPDDPARNAPALVIDRKLRVQPELLLVCEHESRIVGAVIGGFDGVRGWIHHLAVTPEVRRRGLATRLMRAAEDGLRELGAPKVNLQVRATNRGVVAFYEKLGYEVEERVSLGRMLDSVER